MMAVVRHMRSSPPVSLMGPFFTKQDRLVAEGWAGRALTRYGISIRAVVHDE